MRALFGLALAITSACYHPTAPSGAPCNDHGECPSGQACVSGACFVPGTEPDAAVDAACLSAVCLGGDLAGCSSRITCALGCADQAGSTPAHCMELLPSNGITTDLLAGVTADLSGDAIDFDVDDGQIRQAGTLIRPAGTGVMNGINWFLQDGMGVFVAHSFEAKLGEDWTGHGADSLVLFSATTIHITGRIDVGGTNEVGGPGGAAGGASGSTGPTCRGKAGLWQAASFGEGGGGAGGRTAGGAGAPSNLATYGAAGPSCNGLPSTIPLRGGNSGGAGGVDVSTSPDTVHGGAGGGGGGALALVAMESITISGTVTAPGGGGVTGATGDGGGGGGGGGAILIESPVVTLSGDLTANGGGGAGPSVANGSRGHSLDGNPANGGTYMAISGGKGGTGSVSPTSGATYLDGLGTMARGGGGGGAAGRTEIKSRSRTTSGATMSPAPSLTTAQVR